MRLSKIIATLIALVGAGAGFFFFTRPPARWAALNPAYLEAAEADLTRVSSQVTPVTFCHQIHSDGKVVVDPACTAYLQRHPVAPLCAFQNLEDGAWDTKILHRDPARIAASVVAAAAQLHCEQVILDFESLDKREEFTSWAKLIAADLHAHRLSLSVAVHAKTDDAGTWSGAAAQDWPALCASADELLIMAYDNHFPGVSEPGEQAPLDWVKQVLNYARSVCPTSHLRLGLAAYGYKWPTNAVITEREFAESTAATQLPSAPYFVETKAAREMKMAWARSIGVNKFFLWSLGMTATP